MSINSAFASNIPILDDENVIAVVYGHTHTPSVQGKYYCNPLGYPMENKKHNLQATFEIQE
jgi:predicted phosphodiesterase